MKKLKPFGKNVIMISRRVLALSFHNAVQPLGIIIYTKHHTYFLIASYLEVRGVMFFLRLEMSFPTL